MKTKTLLFLLALAGHVCAALGQAPAQGQAPGRMDWWKDAKFGLFIHWGVYSVPAGSYQGKPIGGIGEWIMNNAKIPVADYKQYAKAFNPAKYDPDAWVRMAKEAGMKYIVITSKHHDGFALFDSKVTDWDIAGASPYGKDLLKPLVEACRKHGMRIGFYYSQAQDWVHPGGASYSGHWDKAQDGDMDQYLDRIAVPQVREILGNYGPIDILWWDTPAEMTPARAEKFAFVAKEHPSLITNNRLGGGMHGDLETPEQYVPLTGYPGRNWEGCMTMNDTWGYKADDHNWKSTRTLIRNLADLTSKGGNYLLNVGPTAQGEIPAPSIERLAAVGRWMKTNGESIYGTTASPFAFLSWGRCTRKGQKLYLHVFDYPADGRLVVPLSNAVSKAYLLARPGQPVAAKREGTRTVVQLPAQAPDSINTVVVLDVEGEVRPSPPPVAGRPVTASAQKSAAEAGRMATDGDRLTRWEAPAGSRAAYLEVDLGRPTAISCLIVDEPWYPWDKRSQSLKLLYQDGSQWKTAAEATTGGVGHMERFAPVKARKFRLMVSNPDEPPALTEWQLYGPE